MKCWNCHEENWHLFARDYIGWSDRDMGVCKTCGSVAFQVDPKEEDKVREYYRHNYRGSIGPTNLLTTGRKLNYFKNFIADWLEEREKQGKRLIVGDAGCATGYLVDFFRRRGHKATGSEWTPIMRRFAEHYYGIPTTEELMDKYKYDLIIMYHTFEHMIEPDKKLDRYVNMLSDDGYLVVSVPEWLNIVEEPGAGKVVGFSALFHKDHINVFSYKSLNRMFSNHGLVVEKEDRLTYGQTYLLRKAKPGEKVKDVELEPWEQVVEIIDKQKRAINFYLEALKGIDLNFRSALNSWQKFPDVYYDWVINSTQKKDRGRCAELLAEATEAMPGNVKIRIARAYFLYQNEDWAAALEDFDYIAKKKPNEDILMYKAMTLNNLGRGREAMGTFHDAALMNPNKWNEASVWMCKIAAGMPAWDEVAQQKLKEQMFQQADVTILPQDPLFQENGHTNGEMKRETVNEGQPATL